MFLLIIMVIANGISSSEPTGFPFATEAACLDAVNKKKPLWDALVAHSPQIEVQLYCTEVKQ